jgi:hypothetical protein
MLKKEKGFLLEFQTRQNKTMQGNAIQDNRNKMKWNRNKMKSPQETIAHTERTKECSHKVN